MIKWLKKIFKKKELQRKDKKTEYRIRQNGFGRRWLEYKDVLGWKPVPTPYYDIASGRMYCNEYNGWLGNSFEWFVKEYPDINVYLEKSYKPEQEILEKRAKEYWEYCREKENHVEYL